MASSMVLKQLLAFKSVIPSRPSVATISCFFSTKGDQNRRFSGALNISCDMYVNNPNKDMKENPVGPDKKDITAYMTVGIKAQVMTHNGKVETKDVQDLLKIEDGEYYKSEDLKVKMKNGVLKVTLPKEKGTGAVNKFEIKLV